MNFLRSLLAAIAATIAFHFFLNTFLGEVIFYGLFFDSTPFFYSVLHLVTTTFFGILCIFLAMFLLKERRKENTSLIVVGIWAQLLIIGSLFSGLAFFDLLVGVALYTISVGIILPNFTAYKSRIFGIVNNDNRPS